MWALLKQDPVVWTRIDTVLTHARCNNTKFFMLVLTENGIRNLWGSVKPEDRLLFRNYILQLFLELGTRGRPEEEGLQSKINSIIVEIVKQEWQTTWLDFIPQICGACKTNLQVCSQGLKILRFLSEEIFDFSKHTLTSARVHELKERMTAEIAGVYQLCSEILAAPEQAVPSVLLADCLQTLWAFMSWIPLYYIFETDLIPRLLEIMKKEATRNLAFKCLIEVVSLEYDSDSELGKKVYAGLVSLSAKLLVLLEGMIPASTDLVTERQNLAVRAPRFLPFFDEFCMNLTLFFSGLFKTSLRHFETNLGSSAGKATVADIAAKGLMYLILLTRYPSEHCFKAACQFWLGFTSRLLEESQPVREKSLLQLYGGESGLKEGVYPKVLAELRQMVVLMMVKPDEVIIEYDSEYGDRLVERGNTDEASICELLNSVVANLTRLDEESMKSVLLAKLERQADSASYSLEALNSLCWAVGAMPGIIPVAKERLFLVSVVRILLSLCELKRDKKEKPPIATNIMYVVGRYPNFLNNNWIFLKTVVKKLEEFMREPVVQEMSVKTLLKIAESSKSQFVVLQDKERAPFVDEIVLRIPENSRVLVKDGYRLIFYEAMGHLLSAEPCEARQRELLLGAVASIKADYDQVLAQGRLESAVFYSEQAVKSITQFVKLNERVASSMGFSYSSLAYLVFPSLSDLYLFYSEYVLGEVARIGPSAVNYFTIKVLRNVRRDIFRLFTTFVAKWDHVQPPAMHKVYSELLATSLQKFLAVFRSSPPELRDCELVQLYSTIFEKANAVLEPREVGVALEQLFETALQMINFDFTAFPDMRLAFFGLIRTTVVHCFGQLFGVPEEMFRTLVFSVAWSFKHELNNINEIGLELMDVMLENIEKRPDVADKFYLSYFCFVLESILHVIFDGFHKGGFKFQCRVLMRLIRACLTGVARSQLFPALPGSNPEALFQYMSEACASLFKAVTPERTSYYMQQQFLAAKEGDEKEFKRHLRDYMIESSKGSS